MEQELKPNDGEAEDRESIRRGLEKAIAKLRDNLEEASRLISALNADDVIKNDKWTDVLIAETNLETALDNLRKAHTIDITGK